MVVDNSSLTDLDDVERVRFASGKTYLEFLSVASMSAGVYALPVGADDPQTPHREDELYYVEDLRVLVLFAPAETL